jgi:hypothetical protein
MNTTRKCPKCSGEMKEGFVVDETSANISVQTWVAGKPEKDFLGTVKVIEKETYRIHTFRCQNCRFLEQYA